MKPTRGRNTSWESVSKWYSDKTKNGGHYYHQQVILKNLSSLLALSDTSNVLDLGCGSGVLTHIVPQNAKYTGVDTSQSLLDSAKQQDKNPRHKYIHADATATLPVPTDFTHICFLLSLQNMKDAERAIQNGAKHLASGGVLVIVLNHPAFRIPRQSSWEIDTASKLQYRRINRYMSPLEVPITMHPGQTGSAITWSYHNPISSYTTFLRNAGFVIEELVEWTSDKESVGKAARMENRAREEFPMFLAIRAVKK